MTYHAETPATHRPEPVKNRRSQYRMPHRDGRSSSLGAPTFCRLRRASLPHQARTKPATNTALPLAAEPYPEPIKHRRFQPSPPSPFTHGHHTMAANDMPSGSPPVFRPQFFVFIFCASLPPSNSSPAFIQYVGAKFQACFRHSDQVLIKILRSGSTASSGAHAPAQPPAHCHRSRHHRHELRLKPPRHARCHRRCRSIRRRRCSGNAAHA